MKTGWNENGLERNAFPEPRRASGSTGTPKEKGGDEHGYKQEGRGARFELRSAV